jgi:hypothetical protein
VGGWVLVRSLKDIPLLLKGLMMTSVQWLCSLTVAEFLSEPIFPRPMPNLPGIWYKEPRKHLPGIPVSSKLQNK